MKLSRLAFALLIAFAVFASDSPDTREITDPKSLTSQAELGAGPVPIDDLFYTRGIIGPSWSPNGKEIVFSTNITGRYNLWKVKAAGGWPIQLSQSDDRQSSAAWSPDGKWIVFESDKGGGEIYDLYSIPSDGGEITNLSLTPDISETNPVWSSDGSRIAMNYKPNTASAIDIAILDWKTRAVHNLTQEKTKDHNWSNPVWSPDGKTIYASRANANLPIRMFIASMPQPAPTRISQLTKASGARSFPPSPPTAAPCSWVPTGPADSRMSRFSISQRNR